MLRKSGYRFCAPRTCEIGSLRAIAPALAILALVSCTDGTVERAPLPALIASEISHDAEGRCWARDTAPAVVQTVTAHEIESPAVRAEDGTLVSPATFRTVVRQEIVRERGEQAFETICPPVYTEAFVQSLQRALTARGFYRAEVTGIFDSATRRAVQDYQRRWGPDSPLLSLEGARRLGLVARTLEELEATS